ncbi:MAG TPA: RasGEF domain-containing protein, partial [Candidatus Berkiella sp.]|nr:RasGEF domain-containing protein [Candidatus Berkiella sp.]
MDQNLLCEIACGIIEEKTPYNVLEMLGKIYYLVEPNEQLACLYLAKEFIHQDTHCEWISTDQFNDAYHRLLSTMEINSGVNAHLKLTLAKYYQSKLSSKLVTAELDEVIPFPEWQRKSFEQKKPLKFFVSEVTGLFCKTMLSLSPQSMLTNTIMKDNDDKPAWKNITTLTSQLSHFVCLDILSVKDVKERASRIDFYIAAVGLLLNNKEKTPHLTPAYAVYVGICQNPVTRLKTTWELITEKSRTSFASFEELFQMTNGFSKVRQY